VRRLLELVLDRGSFFEIRRWHGPALVTGLAWLDGFPVGLDPPALARAVRRLE
jgi:acetyl-CoA carboxylase carboxyltransferase component